MMTKTKFSAHQVRELSVAALASPKSVRRVLDGEPTRELTRLRIERAARELGLELPSPERGGR